MGFQGFALFGLVLISAFCTSVFGDQEGFLSLSCGANTSFVDAWNISWISDGAYITVGNTTTVSFNDGNSTPSVSLRFFPDNSEGRKCFRLPVNNTATVLVRGRFYYKNYDGLNRPPYFGVSLGTTTVATVNLSRFDPWVEEFVWPVGKKETLPFCLLPRTGGGTPVISSLEVRPLPAGAYKNGTGEFLSNSLRKRFRVNCGYTNGSLRYPWDSYDRVWDPDMNFSPTRTSTGFEIQQQLNFSTIQESPPARVLQSARVLARREILSYYFEFEKMGDYYLGLYFAGILPVSSTFDILINGVVVEANYSIEKSKASAFFLMQKAVSSLNITLRNISFYPQVNALEVYEMVEIRLECSSTAVSALQVIQESSGADLGWQDDPCSPTQWKHVGCQESLVVSLDLSGLNLRSINPTFGDLLDLQTLDLHNTSLTGPIQNLDSLQELQILNLSFNRLTSFGSDFSRLTFLQIIDLQNNSLEGTVPESLGSLPNLHLLNLENNKLQGTLPQSLNKQTLEVRISGNLCLSFTPSTCVNVQPRPTIQTPQVTYFNMRKKHGHHRNAIIIGAVAGGAFALMILGLFIFMCTRRSKQSDDNPSTSGTDMRSWNAAKIFSYKEIRSATNNFKEVIGRGSFGSVYLGKLTDGKQVAVKVRFDRTQLGSDSFVNEVYLLSQVRHQNLVSLEGFCHESKQQILVYEYVPGGSLADNLYGSNSKKRTLNWVRRLKIAVDAAKGLEYLHNGSNPRIIHRDVKSSNILLDLEMNAKVCDFGLSKQVAQADATHVTTVVKGTAGYLDPEYYSTQQLTEKSDVYSFGVVLLELICGREPLSHSGSPDTYNLVLWAKPYLQAGAFEIVDDNLKGIFDLESMRKVALIASRSVERDASQRPTMAEVLSELKDAYSIQLASLAASGHSG
ncbi:hypothetical protein AMTRI_Chr06g175760 [Amborella trichopoda]